MRLAGWTLQPDNGAAPINQLLTLNYLSDPFIQGRCLLPGTLENSGKRMGGGSPDPALDSLEKESRSVEGKRDDRQGLGKAAGVLLGLWEVRPSYRMILGKSCQEKFLLETPWHCSEVTPTFVTYTFSLCLTCPPG